MVKNGVYTLKKQNKMKKYWIEKIEYPHADCIPYGENSYDNKDSALHDFMCLVQEIKDGSDTTSCASLYEVEDDYDTRIRFYDEGKIENEEINNK